MPEHWNVVPLKHISNINYGLSQPPSEKVDGISLIRATNIFRGIISENDMLFVDPFNLPSKRGIELHEGDIIVVRSGAYTGDSAINKKMGWFVSEI